MKLQPVLKHGKTFGMAQLTEMQPEIETESAGKKPRRVPSDTATGWRSYVNAFLAAMNENNPAWMAFVRARGVGDHVEEDARAQLDAFRKRFE